ncbi:hypothetical protein pb186bvf_011848 [Paramecium bursaria]
MEQPSKNGITYSTYIKEQYNKQLDSLIYLTATKQVIPRINKSINCKTNSRLFVIVQFRAKVYFEGLYCGQESQSLQVSSSTNELIFLIKQYYKYQKQYLIWFQAYRYSQKEILI